MSDEDFVYVYVPVNRAVLLNININIAYGVMCNSL